MSCNCKSFLASFNQGVKLLLILISGGLAWQCSSDKNETAMKINWGSLPDIPSVDGKTEQKGFAGALVGISSDVLFVAGGSNFPDFLPWQGGTKTYYKDIFLFDLNNEDAKWQLSDEKLPQDLAYSACVSVNDEIICVGGENLDGALHQVLKIKMSSGGLKMSRLTDYPEPVSNSGAAAIGSVVYVVGGSGKGGNLSSCYCANLAKDSIEWESLPNIPKPLSNAQVVSQWDGEENCIYVLGGRNKETELSSFYSSIWKYSPSKKVWQQAGEIKDRQNKLLSLAAGTGVAFGKNHILLFGGDDGYLYNKTEQFINDATKAATSDEREAVNKRKITHLECHPGFNRGVLLYNTITEKCEEVGEIPFPTPVTTLAVKYGDKVYIPNGEIRPGVRTPKVIFAKLIKDKQE